jgi:transposase
MNTVDDDTEVILGVDTQLDTHVAVVIDHVGRVQGTLEVPTRSAGYLALLDWARGHGNLVRAGVEGTGTYGAALTRFLVDRGIHVIEVNRPDRSRRRRRGKSDPTDAENAARAVLAGDAEANPKTQCGMVEAMRAVSVARRSAVKARTQAINQVRSLLISAPAAMREALLKVKPQACIAACAELRSPRMVPRGARWKRACACWRSAGLP